MSWLNSLYISCFVVKNKSAEGGKILQGICRRILWTFWLCTGDWFPTFSRSHVLAWRPSGWHQLVPPKLRWVFPYVLYCMVKGTVGIVSWLKQCFLAKMFLLTVLITNSVINFHDCKIWELFQTLCWMGQQFWWNVKNKCYTYQANGIIWM